MEFLDLGKAHPHPGRSRWRGGLILPRAGSGRCVQGKRRRQRCLTQAGIAAMMIRCESGQTTTPVAILLLLALVGARREVRHRNAQPTAVSPPRRFRNIIPVSLGDEVLFVYPPAK
jgi:hypothetical protein